MCFLSFMITGIYNYACMYDINVDVKSGEMSD